jgi:hypothetical protein
MWDKINVYYTQIKPSHKFILKRFVVWCLNELDKQMKASLLI